MDDCFPPVGGFGGITASTHVACVSIKLGCRSDMAKDACRGGPLSCCIVVPDMIFPPVGGVCGARTMFPSNSCLSCSRFSACFGASPHGAYVCVCVQPAVHAGLGSRPFSTSCGGTQHITGTASNEATSDVGSRSWPLRCTCSIQICDIIHRVCFALLNLLNILAVQFRMSHLLESN